MKDTMLAAVFEDIGKLKVKSVPTPKISKDTDILLKVEAVSICGSDLKILEVPPAHPARRGVIMGHEYVGRIREVGKAVTNFKKNDLVVVEPNIPCMKCRYCKENMTHMCDSIETLGETLDGGFAEYNIAPSKQLHLLPPDIPIKDAVLIEPLSCVVGALEKVIVRPSDIAVVQGAGPLGLLFAQMLVSSGAKVIVSELSPMRRRYAELCGVETVVDPFNEDIFLVVKKYSPIGADLIIDAVGSLLSKSIPLLRRCGTLLLFGINDQAKSTVRQFEITRNNLRIFGSFIGSGVFPKAIQLIYDRKIDSGKLITTELPLNKINEGIELLRRQEAVKVLILP